VHTSQVEHAWEYLRQKENWKKVTPNGFKNKMQKWISYFQTYWMRKTHEWNQSDADVRTNNAAEADNKWAAIRFGVHPDLFSFLETLRHIAALSQTRVQYQYRKWGCNKNRDQGEREKDAEIDDLREKYDARSEEQQKSWKYQEKFLTGCSKAMYHRYQRSMRLMEMRIEAEQEVAREVDMAASEELQNMGFLNYLPDPEVSTNSNTTNNNAEDTANSNTNTNSNTAEDVLSEPPTKKRKLK
jgi:hypothetical protein